MAVGRPQTAEHGTDSRYRYGCHCPACREAHAQSSFEWKWERNYGDGAPRGPQWRRQVLSSLATTRDVRETAARLGMTHQAIYAAARAVEDFGRQVAELTAPQR